MHASNSCVPRCVHNYYNIPINLNSYLYRYKRNVKP